MSNVVVDKQKIDILANAIADKSGESVTMTLDEMVSAVDSIDTSGGEPNLQAKTYTVDSAGTETITADAGYDGLSEVEVSVPSATAEANYQTQFETVSNQRKWKLTYGGVCDNAGWLDAGLFGEWDSVRYNAVPSNTSVTPTESAQTVGGADYMMEGAVTVNAIPSNYVGSGIAHRASADLTASGATVTAPSGYYESAATKTISSGTATAPSTISGTSATVSTGTNTLTLSKTISVTPSVSAGYISSGTAGNASVSLTASVNTRSSSDLTASGATVTAPAGYYASAATNTISSGSATTPATTITANPTISVSSGGLITATASATKSVTPTVSAGYVSDGTAGTITVSGSNTSQLTTQAAQTIHPSTTDQTINSGRYLTGTQTIKAVTTTNLSASYILSGVTIKVGDSADDDCVASVTGNVTFSTIYTGSTNPSSGTGVNGDVYIKTS